MVSTCTHCLDHRNRQPSESLIHHEIPVTPWTKVATDVFYLYSKAYVVIIDYTTRYFDIHKLDDCKSSTVINKIKNTFAKFGIPQIVISDNGPEYRSSEFRQFAKDWDFRNITTSPNYPQSNGLVERNIQTIKRTLKKLLESRQDPYLAMLALWTSPLKYNTLSPAQQLMKRTLRTNLPNIMHNKTMKKHEITKKSKELSELKKDDTVRILSQEKWNLKGKIVKKLKEPRSYLIKTEQGKYVRRNRRHILKTKENQKFKIKHDYKNIFNQENSQKQVVSKTTSENKIIPNSTKKGRPIKCSVQHRD